MAANKLIDVSKLNEALVIYDQALRALPFATLTEVANLLKLNVMDLQGKHARINERRRAGGTQSYKIGKNFGLVDKLLGKQHYKKTSDGNQGCIYPGTFASGRYRI